MVYFTSFIIFIIASAALILLAIGIYFVYGLGLPYERVIQYLYGVIFLLVILYVPHVVLGSCVPQQILGGKYSPMAAWLVVMLFLGIMGRTVAEDFSYRRSRFFRGYLGAVYLFGIVASFMQNFVF